MSERTSKDVYERVLGIVAKNTGHAQLPGIRIQQIAITCTHANIDTDRARQAVEIALDNDDLVAWRDRDGHRRYTLVADADLQTLIEHLAERDPPPKGLIGRLNRLRDQTGDSTT